tara:strand:+ start:6263 stop:6898 length:636 start_codon:yes stop_codon:yes gene_type:complete
MFSAIIISLVENKKIFYKKMSECPICLEEFKDDDALSNTECSHTFHSKCIFRAITVNLNCPSCRTPLVSKQIEENRLHESNDYSSNNNLLRRITENIYINNNQTSTENIENNIERDISHNTQRILDRVMFDVESNLNSSFETNDNVVNSNRQDIPRLFLNGLATEFEELNRQVNSSIHNNSFLYWFNQRDLQHESMINRSLRERNNSFSYS